MKTYEFLFTAQPAEFSASHVTIRMTFGGQAGCASEDRCCTLAEALAYLPVYSASIAGPHRASVRMRYSNDRKPAGFATAKTTFDNETGV